MTGILPGFVNTNLVDSIKRSEIKNVIIEKWDRIAISPYAVAEAIIYAIGQPSTVDVGDIVIQPTAQD